MNHVEHLLTCLGEEGCEVAQDVAKSLRFGLSDRNVLNFTGPTNRERLINELNDLEAVADMLAAFDIIPLDWRDAKKQAAKKLKVMDFMDYAKKVGALKGRS